VSAAFFVRQWKPLDDFCGEYGRSGKRITLASEKLRLSERVSMEPF
jgi:hypothetical protein